jgi:hypothetical protein
VGTDSGGSSVGGAAAPVLGGDSLGQSTHDWSRITLAAGQTIVLQAFTPADGADTWASVRSRIYTTCYPHCMLRAKTLPPSNSNRCCPMRGRNASKPFRERRNPNEIRQRHCPGEYPQFTDLKLDHDIIATGQMKIYGALGDS